MHPTRCEQLCEAMLDSLQTVPVPTLKRALRGPAGPRICEVALSVVINGDFTGINPRLGKELERVFAHAARGTLRRSMNQPFLRLGDDLASLEIVGPRQEANSQLGSGLSWVVNGRRFPTLRNQEFVDKVTDEPRVTIEPLGLVGGLVSPRNFTILLADRTEPFILFDERTRRERRSTGSIPAGAYWLLHSSAHTLTGGQERYDWSDGMRSLSFFRARPGVPIELQGDGGRTWLFTASPSPFFEVLGDSLAAEAQEIVHFGWSELPFIWLPSEQASPELIEQWRINVRAGAANDAFSIVGTSEQIGGMVKCRIECGDFLNRLGPAMHRVNLTLIRSGRSRGDALSEYLLWQGLRVMDGRGFQVTALPENLVRQECRGFEFESLAIVHKHDQYRQHRLSFDLGGSLTTFEWSQPGIYLDSLERKPGERSHVRPHRLGDVFSASLDSVRWLRVWITGESGWEILVAGKLWQRAVGDDRRDFLEFSLASLSLTFPEGGDIRLKVGFREVLVARFSSPLKPIAAEFQDDSLRRGFRFHFTEPIAWARPTVWDLATGQKHQFDGRKFGTVEDGLYASHGLPQIECVPEAETTLARSGRHYATLWVPKLGWPPGLWLIELEVRRDEEAEWQSVLVNGREYAPLVVRTAQGSTTIRSELLGVSLRPLLQDTEIPVGPDVCSALIELLTDMMVLRKREFVLVARQDMGWLKDALRCLSQMAGRVARRAQSEGFQAGLLNLACQDSQHAGFVYLPGLLALPGGEYAELPSGDPLNDSLRRCGRLALADSVAAVVKADFAFLDMHILSCFDNFATVANDTDPDSPLEFAAFAYEKYWQEIIGTVDVNRLAADWTGDAVLGRIHTLWAFGELLKRYEASSHDLKVAAANKLLHSAPLFRSWLSSRLTRTSFAPPLSQKLPWLRLSAPETDFLEAVPRFASLFALAARASAAGLLTFDETLTWLESQVERRYMAEEGIAALVGLAPELFGHQLLFWELMIHTALHRGNV